MAEAKAPPTKKEIREQRDRFLAFAFSSADLFLEVSIEGKVLYALGASKGMTGFTDQEIIGRNWLEVFSVYDQGPLVHLYENSKTGERCGPVMVDLNELVTKRKAIVTGIKMPSSKSFYLTLAFGNIMMGKLSGSFGGGNGGELLTRESFVSQAQEAYEMGRSLGQDLDMTFFDLFMDEDDRKRLGEDGWNKMMASITGFLQSQAVDGQTAAQISDNRYSFVHDKNIDNNFIKDRIQSLIKSADPDGEAHEVQIKTIHSDLSSLSEREASKALVYTINEFDRKGVDFTIESLNSGLKDYTEANAQKIKEFQDLIKRLDFSLHFQPIVSLENPDEVSHYEMLTRFNRGDTLEWITFGEDMGLAPEFDIAVCERAINHISYKAAGLPTKFAVNLSGQSIEDDNFVTKLIEKLENGKDIRDRLMFEITESSHIQNLDKVNKVITRLQKDGFKVALDDFGAGATSFQYLQKLTVDYVKIDGKYVRKLMSSQRDAAMIKNITQMCKDLNIQVIAEFIEDATQAEMLKEMGVDYGQGYYFGRPESSPSYTPPRR